VDPLTSSELARICELAEANAWTDTFRSASPELASDLGLNVERVGSAILLMAERIPSVSFNRVLALGMDEPVTEAALDEIRSRYEQRGIGEFMIQASPEARPALLPEWLSARGYAPGGNWAKVYRGVELPPEVPTELQVESIGPAYAEMFGQVFVEGYELPEFFGPWVASAVGRPGWSHYVAYANHQPAAVGALFVSDRVGWLGVDATRSEFRRRGGQGTLMARRIRDAAALGCEWLATETGEDRPENPNSSYHNMLRVGFKLAYLRPNWVAG
jgi:hypothetical protein